MSGSAQLRFQESIISLLSAPGPLHIPRLPFGHGGHGPIDVFSTRFTNLFPDDVDANVNGVAVDKAGLKDNLVTLKKSFDSTTAAFTNVDGESTYSAVAGVSLIRIPDRQPDCLSGQRTCLDAASMGATKYTRTCRNSSCEQ
jgi:hypothetical protein